MAPEVPESLAAPIDLRDLLRPGDCIAVPQGASEPLGLCRALADQAHTLTDVSVFIGLSFSGLFDTRLARRCRIRSYGAMGGFSSLLSAGLLDVVPCNYSDLPRLIRGGHLRCDVVFLQVAPPDANGEYNAGLCMDYAVEAIAGARLVIAEVNDQLPRPATGLRLPARRIDVAVPVSRPLITLPRESPSELDRVIADRVAALVPDGATLQLGFGATVNAIGQLLTKRRDLRVHSALVGDWLLDLEAAGALAADDERPVITTGAVLGSQALYDFVANSSRVQLLRIEQIQSPAALSRQPRLVAVNSALQVDLAGQTNTETVGVLRVSALGGHTDFLRGAQCSPGGLGIVALPSTARGGRTSRIVRRLDSGWVSTQQSAVDVVVTEHGCADLRGSTVRQRERALLAVAAPHLRNELMSTTSAMAGNG